MANIFENKDRRVIPNWRSFKKTSILGELDSPLHKIPKLDISLSIDSYIRDWLIYKTPAHAGDLISAAIVNGFEHNDNVINAAKFLINKPNSSTQAQISLAKKIILETGDKNHSFKLDAITHEEFHDYLNPELIWKKIHLLKKNAIDFNFNPIIWVELSRQYSIIGQKNKALNAMKIALQLAPENRFVLRSSVRLFAHYDELELSHDIVRKNKITNIDPWLTSAEISLATLRNRTSKFMKLGLEMINSKKLSSFSITELASSLGTVELINGSGKKSRELFKKSMISPNDNSLAQVEWASKLDKNIEVNPSSFNIKNNFEAKALDNFQNEKLDDALNETVKWFLDMPFAKRPVMLGSHIGSLINDPEISREFLKAGLISHPNDPQLINNIVYSLALENKTNEAMEYLEKVTGESKMEKTTEVCLTATRGLVYFRTGFHDIGRRFYLDALQESKTIQNPYYNWLALLNYAREELIVKSEFVESIMENVSYIPSDTVGSDIKKLKNEVTEMYNKQKESKT